MSIFKKLILQVHFLEFAANCAQLWQSVEIRGNVWKSVDICGIAALHPIKSWKESEAKQELANFVDAAIQRVK